MFTDEYFMKQALLQAKIAYERGEVPIGAVVVAENEIIGRGYNQVEMLGDVTAHAETIAMSAASEYLGAKYLTDCTLYVTIEPCPMCAGALYWARPARVVFGSHEPKFGFHTRKLPLLHPKTELTGGVMAFECMELMQRFFLERRG